MSPEVVIAALAGVISTIAGLFYRELLRRATAAEAEAASWRERYLLASGLAEMATDEAEKRRPRK